MTTNIEHQLSHCSRRTFLSSTLATPAIVAGLTALVRTKDVKVSSPNGNVQFQLVAGDAKELGYRVTFKNNAVIDLAQLGIIIDDVDLSKNVDVIKVETYRIDEHYQSRGVHSRALNRCNGGKIEVKHSASGTNYTIEVRAFNDGIAFRYVVPANSQPAEKPRAPDEASSFAIPAGSTLWFHDFEGHYEGVHAKKEIGDVKPGEWAAVPMTFKLPNAKGYASITEAALINYAGMGLQANGNRTFRARLGHAQPVSYPFRLRYKEDIERLAKPASISGTITTPWRVVMVGADLNTLVNSDIISNLSPPPDAKIFPAGLNTEWLKPGRSVWKYLDGGENTLDGMKEFSQLAGQLGFEYNLVEGFWQRWPETQLKELVEFSRQHKVGIWLWKHSRDLRTSENRRAFFKVCNDAGVVGAKIDFFDHEAKEIIDLYQVLLKDSAEAKIMVDFHGANKPAGEARTWPNEMTREGIRGLEYRNTATRAQHNTTLPFTRMLAGHADYSVMHFGERRRETSWAHQIASAVIISAPVLIYGAHPKNILENPAVELIKSIPSVWDETIVLPGSEIGEIASFARRNGHTWFVAIMNGPNTRTVKTPPSFLGRGQSQAMLVRDRMDDAAALEIEESKHVRTDQIPIEMRAGGGFVGRFS
ncbi:MAG: glycoside hydrolase family 97 protein [Pyrinomonadaceae bacterium]|nr:glycoside hydrolase family 97 protein [Pyrinomonadaceae bacterium]